MLISVLLPLANYLSGCRLAVSHVDTRKSCNKIASYTLRCTHGRVYKNNGSSIFEAGDVGPNNVVTEFIKRVKTNGATKGKFCTVLFRVYDFVY